MPPPVATVPAKKRSGQELPTAWRAKFLAHYREHGGLWRSAEAADVSHETVRRHRAADPEFDQQVCDARQVYADRIEERMIDSAERSDNPAGFIVRLKALRPHEYIEKHAVLNLNVTTELDPADGLRLLRAMYADASPETQALIQGPAALGEGTP